MLQRFGFALIALLSLGTAHAEQRVPFDPGLAGFSMRVKGLDLGYREFVLFAMPGEAVSIGAADLGAHLTVNATAGDVHATGTGQWTWHAPAKPGNYPIDIVRADGARMRLEAFVMVPASGEHGGRLNGYRIGQYPRQPLKSLGIYQAPPGFVEVTQELAQVRVSPHFTLGEFLCKEGGGYPKYLVLNPRLLLKLEAVVAYLDAHGVPPDAVHVMSGYRTPWYNSRLGNVEYSRHMWGDAADIYIAPRGGNADAAEVARWDDYRDSNLLAADVDRLFSQPGYAYLRGGIGVYAATRNHPPFVHVDARGFNARW